MLERLIRRLAVQCCEHAVLSEQDVDVFLYGMDLFLFSVLSIGAFAAAGALTGTLPAVLCVLLFFIPLQSFGGGYHAGTHLRCFLITGGMLAVCVLCGMRANPRFLAPGVLLSALAIFRLAPVDNANAPCSTAFRARMRRVVRGACLIELALFGVAALCSWPSAGYMGMAMVASGISMGCATVKNAYVARAVHRKL